MIQFDQGLASRFQIHLIPAKFQLHNNSALTSTNSRFRKSCKYILPSSGKKLCGLELLGMTKPSRTQRLLNEVSDCNIFLFQLLYHQFQCHQCKVQPWFSSDLCHVPRVPWPIKGSLYLTWFLTLLRNVALVEEISRKRRMVGSREMLRQ